jgi:hypothetical protein
MASFNNNTITVVTLGPEIPHNNRGHFCNSTCIHKPYEIWTVLLFNAKKFIAANFDGLYVVASGIKSFFFGRPTLFYNSISVTRLYVASKY